MITRTEIPDWRSGTGKVIAVGDTVRVDGKQAEYRVKKLVAVGTDIEVHCFGGKNPRFRVFLASRCSRVLHPKENHG